MLKLIMHACIWLYYGAVKEVKKYFVALPPMWGWKLPQSQIFENLKIKFLKKFKNNF